MTNRLPALKGEYKWLEDTDSQAPQSSLRNLAAAIQNFFEGRGQFPRSKSKHAEQSVQYPQRVRLDGKRIYVTKVGWVKAVVHRDIVGKVRTVTASKNPCGHSYAALLIDDGQEPSRVSEEERAIGIDLGLTDLAVAGDGSKFPNPRHSQAIAVESRQRANWSWAVLLAGRSWGSMSHWQPARST